jgi:hypothetical protein
MRHILIESGHFITEYEKVKKLKSRLIWSAIKMVESAYWLVGGDNYAQALIMFDGAIELLLKGELERIHPILIADNKSLANYEFLKSFIKDSFRNHPAGKHLPIPDPDIERTIYFGEAFDRVAKLYRPTLDKWSDRLVKNPKSLHNIRNAVVHYGVKEEGECVSAIIEIALPFIEEFLILITQDDTAPIRLSHLLYEWVYREVDVAKNVLNDLRKNSLPPAAYAIAPLAHHILWTNTRWTSPTDDQDSIACGISTPWSEYESKYKNPEGWTDNVVKIDCPICKSHTSDGEYIQARVLLEDESLDRKQLIPEGFICLVCGFRIDPSQKYLAKYFVPPIPDDTAEALLKDAGII